MVVYSDNIEKARAFYEAIGCKCVQEKHGSGPLHYSMDFGKVIIELYPRGKREVSRVRLGIITEVQLSVLSASLKESIKTLGKDFVIVVDPDGNTIEITNK